MEQNAPQNETKPSIKLLNGTTLECYPRTGDIPERSSDPHFEPERQRLFEQNAYYLLEHADVIMSDSRMFLAEAPEVNGLVGPGAFLHDTPPCIGAYLEWWSIVYPQSTRDDAGKDALITRLVDHVGSVNHYCMVCNMVYPDGSICFYREKNDFDRFYNSLRATARRYHQASHIYEAYTFEQVIDLLHEYDAKVSDPQERRVKVLEQEVARMRNMVRTVQEDHNEELRMVLSLFDDRLRDIKNAHKSQKREVDAQIAELQRQRRNFKQQYKEGLITQQEYQGKVKETSSQRTDYERELKDIREKPLRELVKDNLKLYNIFSKYMEEL